MRVLSTQSDAACRLFLSIGSHYQWIKLTSKAPPCGQALTVQADSWRGIWFAFLLCFPSATIKLNLAPVVQRSRWGQLSMRKERMKGRGHGGQVAISSFHYLTSLKLDWIATPADNQSLVKFYQNAIYNVHKRRIRKRARSAGSGTMA